MSLEKSIRDIMEGRENIEATPRPNTKTRKELENVGRFDSAEPTSDKSTHNRQAEIYRKVIENKEPIMNRLTTTSTFDIFKKVLEIVEGKKEKEDSKADKEEDKGEKKSNKDDGDDKMKFKGGKTEVDVEPETNKPVVDGEDMEDDKKKKKLSDKQKNNIDVALPKGKITSADFKKLRKEDVNINESDYPLYHDQYTHAVNTALRHHAKKGIQVSDDDHFKHISTGPRKPAEGDTVSHNIPATDKDGKEHIIHMQIYNKGGKTPYELNTYSSKVNPKMKKEEVEAMEEESLDEGFEVGEVYHIENRDGERSHFIPIEKQKNGKYKGMQFDQGASGRSSKKPTTASYEPNYRWKKTPKEEIPNHISSVLKEEEIDEMTLDKAKKYVDANIEDQKERAKFDGFLSGQRGDSYPKGMFKDPAANIHPRDVRRKKGLEMVMNKNKVPFTTKEEVEEIDEVSRDRATERKAALTPERKAALERYLKAPIEPGETSLRSMNRLIGSYRAAKRLKKEEVENVDEKVNAYAVGMAQAEKSTGDKPPLKKSTIVKAHEIAKKIEKNEDFSEVELAHIYSVIETYGAMAQKNQNRKDEFKNLKGQESQKTKENAMKQQDIEAQKKKEEILRQRQQRTALNQNYELEVHAAMIEAVKKSISDIVKNPAGPFDDAVKGVKSSDAGRTYITDTKKVK